MSSFPQTLHAPTPRGFAALMYAIMLAASLLLLTFAAFAAEAEARQQLSLEEDSDRSYLAARACVAFTLRALTVDPDRIFASGTQVHTEVSTVCVLDRVAQTESSVDVSAQARVGSHTSRLTAHARRTATGALELESLRDGTEQN
jgi:hypothetical protein